jgi:hypothetical protein
VSVETVAGMFLLAMPVAFNAAFGLLAARFDYPDILRRPDAEVLTRFQAGGAGLVLLWWGFAMTAVLFAPLVVLLSQAIGDADGALLAVASTVGVLAAVVQFLGLVRWPFLVPYLARVATDPDATATQRETAALVFQSFNRYLGVGVGEHLGYALTGAWSVLAGVALTDTAAVPSWLGIPGVIAGAALLLCSLEFVGPHEPSGWKLAEKLTPIAYVVWSLWLFATGAALVT